MHAAKRLVTSIEVDEPSSTPPDADRQMSISASLELELEDGRRVTLLDDRGWSSSGPSDIWAYTSLEDLADTARTVVGPDEPPDHASYEEEEASYWAQMATNARERGVRVEAGDLRSLSHDVDISQEVRARIARAAR
ncbi:hypothetical protein WDZ16_02810 [Pseudokineococcus marinus]|uniref:Uncharacterized protein n=1 Tax=Pseudokineococcus marinus TaxID=351215 RepID=A0A849BTD8_9ACTN|nr:hypothetical protein [Pseudokineococcus marinus]NNH23714.1 hypothetical protein [Pseudokineococcus marinus]